MRKLYAWLLVLLLIIIFGTMYVLQQQAGRLAANDGPAAVAHLVADELNGSASQTTLPLGKLNIATTLQPFVIIYDKNYKPVAGTGYLNGNLPVVDKGVLQHATTGHDNVVTWQPQTRIRIATVTTKAGQYYVLGGQSLAPAESRADKLLRLTALGWLVSLVCVLLVYTVVTVRK